MKDLIEQMKGEVFQYRKASKELSEKGYYLRQRSYKYKNLCDLYILQDNKVKMLAYNCTFHRCKQLINAFTSGKLKDVSPEVLQNYTTNGYNTRKGLFANYSDTNIKRIKQIAFSHAEIMQDGKFAHEKRVLLRNRNY